ncbi:MAG: nucleotidyltransferase domain-containing protein [Nitrososphaerota archaeon]
MYTSVRDGLIRLFEAETDVLAAYLFGSHSRGSPTFESDLDIAVLLRETPQKLLDHFLHLLNKLSEVLGDKVDLVILNTAPPLLKYQIIRWGRPIYSRDERARTLFEARTTSEYLDFSRAIKRYDECLMKHILT